MAETLREFLIALGWDTERGKRDQHQFEAAITSATLKAQLLGDLLVEIAKKVGEAVKEAATKFDDLYFAAQRANSSAGLAHDFPLLIKKYGGNAAEASSLLEAAAQKLRENRNNISVLNKLGFGLDATTGKLEIQQEMLENLRNLSVQQVENLASVVGISAQPILLMKRHLDEVLPDLAGFEAYRKSLGFNIEQAAIDGKNFQTIWRDVSNKLSAIADMIGSALERDFTAPMQAFDDFITANGAQIGEAIGEVTKALADMTAAWVKDFGAVLGQPDELGDFRMLVKGLADSIADIAMRFHSLVGWLVWMNGSVNTPGSMLNQADRAVNPPAADIVKGLNDQKDAPAWDWKGGASKAWNWAKGLVGAGGGEPATPAVRVPSGASPDANAPPARSGAPLGGGTVIFGDSIGAGLAGALHADSDNAVVGKTPDWVAKRISAYRQSLAGKDVVISSGASNEPHAAATIRQQIQAAIDKGADPKRITVLGVGSLSSALGNYPGASAEVNSTLRSEAARAGANFQALPPGTDVHPDYGALAGSLSRPNAAPTPPMQIPAFGGPLISGAMASPPILGGASGDTHINAPTQTTIHVDGTGDPVAVARLVHGAQKGVNDDLSQALQAASP